ncbi:hypothetical protein COT60_01070 [Candidatus Pacearchaeota archaeon CG09_land_8_20_14_0_10_30_9]|nr:hypothetical protein [Candidatus Pacearchaeota archaeon]OIO40298.1 MAG: hypothetical protein AUJ61_02080 [Candidatus Pacearchaeota archaeon CG1_02_30_18]PIN71225.1 MAG: hypothetical protein COV77_03060 [Candidatus Pacearchaeota archaeon CG11_big_fil_rev_8_21_14_0_20_30_13]PIO01330.1 MAG: hypothetical protein COT60_01070 [Candidatus Pacearchaeota archaeon CG09_land_8_20_14_0_10_30_9]PIZ82326.1 MAG: hypothetical protein COX98_00235 [Candidatus Pacearchaeota archaeon CG_4_10_14_0_2_um_filter_30
MVKKTNLEGEIVFKCERCGLFYRNKGVAKKCENWCNKNNSCNYLISKVCIKLNKLQEVK